MEGKILNYSISLALCFLMVIPLRAQNGNMSAPQGKTPPKAEKKTRNRRWNIHSTMAYLSGWIYGDLGARFSEVIS